MKDSFSKTHPALLFIYFAAVIILSTVCFHPVMIGISLFFALIYMGAIFGYKKMVMWLLITLIYILAFGAINPFLNHQGATVLFMAFGRNITLESVCYGGLTGAMLGSVCIWIYILSKTISSKQAAFVFGKALPTITLMVYIILGMFKRYRKKAVEIFEGRKGFFGEGDTFKTGVKTSDSLLTFALENGVDTADSMCSRGYGVAAPTRYYAYTFRRRDYISSLALLVALIIVLWGIFAGGCKMYFFPVLFVVSVPMTFVYIAFGVFSAYPFITYVWSELLWKSIK